MDPYRSKYAHMAPFKNLNQNKKNDSVILGRVNHQKKKKKIFKFLFRMQKIGKNFIQKKEDHIIIIK